MFFNILNQIVQHLIIILFLFFTVYCQVYNIQGGIKYSNTIERLYFGPKAVLYKFNENLTFQRINIIISQAGSNTRCLVWRHFSLIIFSHQVHGSDTRIDPNYMIRLALRAKWREIEAGIYYLWPFNQSAVLQLTHISETPLPH